MACKSCNICKSFLSKDGACRRCERQNLSGTEAPKSRARANHNSVKELMSYQVIAFPSPPSKEQS